MNFIEELYYGNINPNEKKVDRSSQYAKALKIFCENESKLTKTLSGDSLKLFNDMVNASDEMTAAVSVENFKMGFVLGVQMMADCFKFDTNMIFKDL